MNSERAYVTAEVEGIEGFKKVTNSMVANGRSEVFNVIFCSFNYTSAGAQAKEKDTFLSPRIKGGIIRWK
ncbi:MAG: hypothetical protein U9R10_03170 [Euryarchaeota archaeon]|nr:hypothetical protein [Euryarchaeota archaeon]